VQLRKTDFYEILSNQHTMVWLIPSNRIGGANSGS
jgi:hypothetical protein